MKNIGYCKVCGKRIQRLNVAKPWRHQSPQPNGHPNDHNAVFGGQKPEVKP